MSAGKPYPFAQMRFLLLIFGSGKVTIAVEHLANSGRQTCVTKPKPPRADPRAGGFAFGPVFYLILLVPFPFAGILPITLRMQGVSGNSLCSGRRLSTRIST